MGFSGALMRAQDSLSESPHKSTSKVQAVEYLYPEQITVPADKPTALKLHFRIQQNLHINSHTLREQYLIPTVLDRKSTRLNSSHLARSRMPSSA